MTENSNETIFSTQFYNQIKRELTNSPCTVNDVTLGFYNDNVESPTSNLTNSNLTYNVQIVLENLKRSAGKIYLQNANINNNNQIQNINTIENTQNNLINVNTASEKMSSSGSDCNSNVHANLLQQLASSIASSHDFTHDNSDYQWFLDYK